MCRDCGLELPLEDFSPSKKNADGRTSYCRPCFRVRDKAYRAARAAARGTTVRTRRAVAEGHGHCPECDTTKPLSDFGRRTGKRNGRVAYCHPCFNRIKEESRERLHGSTRNYHLKRRYGITVEDYDRMLAEQGGLCALCQERPAEHVDHDHVTGRVRGLLCFCCNQGLGNFRDRADVLRLAIGYLRASTWQKERLEPGVYRLHPPRVS
ncbi:MAG: hypothetical protein AVDCRST_MAG16-2207 [uncultured Frankineae bacterium]|uniref:Recombination endonuclease VII n=1 Tax=uncultured Frankineae bacterium TaxID=437475 RepID=A0A6J4M2U1_9ACTN|nr:MAG: hypothetical protein AVDCRST_MAG16-2207 [uncultured Frankineae bacterium]